MATSPCSLLFKRCAQELQAKVRVQGINPRDVGLDKFDAHIREDMARLAPILQSVAEKR